MKILLATKTMEVGGIERSVVSVARELRKRGHHVVVVSSGGRLVPELTAHRTVHVSAPLELTYPLAVLRSAWIIRRVIEHEQIDLVHSFSATASVAVSLALRTLRASPSQPVRVISSPMGLQNSPRESPVTTWLRNWFLTLGAARILVISPEIRRHLTRVGARDAQLVDFNFVGLNLEDFQANEGDYQSVRAEFGFPPQCSITSTIGALHPRKSHELFVEAAANIHDKDAESRFLIVGGGELKHALEAQIRERGLEGIVVLTDVRDDVARLLAATDVYVKPGVVEGYIGITVLEAMALNKPVVAFETEDVKLALTNGVTGVIVPNSNTQALADEVLHLLGNPADSARLGAAGRAVVHEKFDFAAMAERLEHFYLNLVGGSHLVIPVLG